MVGAEASERGLVEVGCPRERWGMRGASCLQVTFTPLSLELIESLGWQQLFIERACIARSMVIVGRVDYTC
jgi:hypothetical protein